MEKDNAIHGLLRWTLWEPLARTDDSVTLGTTLCPQPGYPFLLDVRVEYRLGPEGLGTTVRATNIGTEPAPYGVGQHPYLTVGTHLVDSAVLTVPARTLLRTDGRGLPIGQEPVDGTPYDFRTARPIGDLRLDTAFTGLDRDPDGRAVVRLAHPQDCEASISGSATAPAGCRCTRATPWPNPSGGDGESPWRRCPVHRTPSGAARTSPSCSLGRPTCSAGS